MGDKQRFLTVYDYGTGGCWYFIEARNKQEILGKFDELKIIDTYPDWLKGEHLARLEADVHDIDSPPKGALALLLKKAQ